MTRPVRALGDGNVMNRSGLTDAGYTIEDGMRIDEKSGEQLHFTGRSPEREVSIMLMVTPKDVATAVYTLTPAQG